MQQIFFNDRLIERKIKDVLKLTDLVVLFSGNLIGLQTQDGEEGCMIEHYYDIGDNSNDPREAVISSFFVDNKFPKRIFKELENKLYFKFIDC